jgi:hypothetical protein
MKARCHESKTWRTAVNVKILLLLSSVTRDPVSRILHSLIAAAVKSFAHDPQTLLMPIYLPKCPQSQARIWTPALPHPIAMPAIHDDAARDRLRERLRGKRGWFSWRTAYSGSCPDAQALRGEGLCDSRGSPQMWAVDAPDVCSPNSLGFSPEAREPSEFLIVN